MRSDPIGGGNQAARMPPEVGAMDAVGALLDFGAWAALSARLLKLGIVERIDILDQRGISPEDWTRADDIHAKALAEDIAAGRMDRAELYGRGCAAELERRRRNEPDEPRPSADGKAPPLLGESPAPSAPVAGAPAVAEHVPSFLQHLALAGVPSPPSPSLLAGTMAAVDLPSFVKAASKPLPFGDTPTPDFLASIDAERPGPSNAAGATIGVGVDLLAQVQHTLPFAKADADGAKPGAQAARFPRLPLETYASLCAELSVFPERTAEILQKYGVKDEAARQALGKEWDARLLANPDTREEWQRLCDTYAEYLRKGGR